MIYAKFVTWMHSFHLIFWWLIYQNVRKQLRTQIRVIRKSIIVSMDGKNNYCPVNQLVKVCSFNPNLFLLYNFKTCLPLFGQVESKNLLHTLNMGCSFNTLREPCNNQRPRCDIVWLHVINHLYQFSELNGQTISQVESKNLPPPTVLFNSFKKLPGSLLPPPHTHAHWHCPVIS
jgi:hypothetical protein